MLFEKGYAVHIDIIRVFLRDGQCKGTYHKITRKKASSAFRLRPLPPIHTHTHKSVRSVQFVLLDIYLQVNDINAKLEGERREDRRAVLQEKAARNNAKLSAAHRERKEV